MKTIEQEFATEIYKQVLGYKGSKDEEDYRSMTFTLPVLVRTAGLAQALAFVESRKKDYCDQLLDHLAKVVMIKDEEKTQKAFVEKSRTANLEEYMYLTKRTLLALKWYKRFAQSVLGVTGATVPPAGDALSVESKSKRGENVKG
jgi:CRISPR-associated protein Cmr5